MGRGRFSGSVIVSLLAAALGGAPSSPAISSIGSWSPETPRPSRPELNQAGSSGYRLSALVDRADDLAAIVTHAAGNERFEYAVLGADKLDAVSDLGKRGYAWRASATALGWATPAIVLERPSSGLAAHELRVVVADDVAALEGQLADPFAQGFHVVGRQRVEQKKVWVVLERANGAPAREVRVISADGREKLEGALASAASQGFAFETFWAHPAGVFRRDPLVAIVARPKGSTAPAPHCSIEEESRTLSGSSAHLVALDTVDQGREYLAAWCPRGRRSVLLARHRPRAPAGIALRNAGAGRARAADLERRRDRRRVPAARIRTARDPGGDHARPRRPASPLRRWRK
jgi:hypothetical protein